MTPQRQYHDWLLSQFGGTWFDFEGLIRDIYVSILKPGDTALDIGMHVGGHFCQMLKAVGPSGYVIGVEAAPSLVSEAKDLISKLGLEKRNFTIHNVAVSDHEGKVNLRFIKDFPGLSSLANRDAAKSLEQEEIEIELTTIEKLLSEVQGQVRFTKIDIEGSE